MSVSYHLIGENKKGDPVYKRVRKFIQHRGSKRCIKRTVGEFKQIPFSELHSDPKNMPNYEENDILTLFVPYQYGEGLNWDYYERFDTVKSPHEAKVEKESSITT